MTKMKYTVIGINAHLVKIHTLEAEITIAQIAVVSLSGLAIAANVLRIGFAAKAITINN